jgi:hypothetical protein
MIVGNESQYRRWLRSYESIDKFFGRTGTEPRTIIVSGWCDPKYLGDVKEKISSDSKLMLLPSNLGKSRIVNEVVSAMECEVMMIVDSDIVLTGETIDWEVLENFSVAVFAQGGDCRHAIFPSRTTAHLIGDRRYLTTAQNYGFAGGAMLVRRKLLLEHPLPEFGVYGPEDVVWFYTLHKVGISVALMCDCRVLHPTDEDSREHEEKLLLALSKMPILDVNFSLKC